jgi:hypothetical protein
LEPFGLSGAKNPSHAKHKMMSKIKLSEAPN